MKPFGFKYKCNRLVSQIFLKIISKSPVRKHQLPLQNKPNGKIAALKQVNAAIRGANYDRNSGALPDKELFKCDTISPEGIKIYHVIYSIDRRLIGVLPKIPAGLVTQI